MSIQKSQQVPVAVVGSSKFGLYPKINDERTYNMFISDEWLINYAGYQKVSNVVDDAEGRGLFHSIRGNFAIAVIGSAVYRFNPGSSPQYYPRRNAGMPVGQPRYQDHGVNTY